MSGKQLSLFDLSIPHVQTQVIELSPSDSTSAICHVDKLEESLTGFHPYLTMLRRLGISEIPRPDDKEAALKAMLDGIGESEIKLGWVLSETDFTKRDLLSAGSQAERERLRKALTKDLRHSLAGFSGTEEWHQHRCFSPLPILLTDGALYLAENGGGSGPSAFWLMDAIASYQGQKELARHSFQIWRLIVTPETEGKSRSAMLLCGDNIQKPIVRQEIEFTDFLLEGETMLFRREKNINPEKSV